MNLIEDVKAFIERLSTDTYTLIAVAVAIWRLPFYISLFLTSWLKTRLKTWCLFLCLPWLFRRR